MKATLRSYITGFIISIALTLVAYSLVQNHVNSGHMDHSHDSITIALIGLALMQFIVQAMFFLHLKKKGDARWNLLAFIFMSGIVAIIVLGSMWIMANLDYHHSQNKTPEEHNEYIIKDELPAQQEHDEESQPKDHEDHKPPQPEEHTH